MNITISSERFDIISSGAVIIPANDYIEFKIDDLRFRITMIGNDENSSQGTIQTSLEKDDKGECMVISLVGFASSFFATPKQDLKLAFINNRDLLLKFSFTSINRSEGSFDGLLCYTWMLSKEERVTINNKDDVGE